MRRLALNREMTPWRDRMPDNCPRLSRLDYENKIFKRFSQLLLTQKKMRCQCVRNSKHCRRSPVRKAYPWRLIYLSFSYCLSEPESYKEYRRNPCILHHGGEHTNPYFANARILATQKRVGWVAEGEMLTMFCLIRTLHKHTHRKVPPHRSQHECQQIPDNAHFQRNVIVYD